jgi:hypothetical protein
MDIATRRVPRSRAVQAVAKRRQTRLGARLAPEPAIRAAWGRADYRADRSGRSISVSLHSAPPGMSNAALLLDRTAFATVPVSPDGSVSYAVDTRSGATLPRLRAGATIAWADAATGAVIVSGALR